MDFKFTIGKVIASFIFGFIVPGLILMQFISGNDIILLYFFIAWLVFSGVVYVVWSLFQKKSKESGETEEKPREESEETEEDEED
ncbi:MAG: hypothetical protein ACOCP4_04540, partial [Candidatus Woesearchaeota archaeon]